MELTKITIDPTLLIYTAQALGRVPENLYDFQKIKNLPCGGRPVYQKLIDPAHDPVPERLEIVRGDFSIIGKMTRLKKLLLSAMPVRDFSFLADCAALESLEISACGVIDCAFLKDLKNLKSLKLLHCSGLEHAEDILKLPRLTKLSLEGSEVSDVSCFLHCGIEEVYLPVKNLKTKPGAAVRAKRSTKQSGPGVPFHRAERKPEQYPYTLQALDSPLWETYRGAYGNVSEYLGILAGERDAAPETFKIRRLETAPKTNYELAFDNLCENLWHQMSFYPATWLAVPYLARLMESWERDQDLEWMFQGILAVGSCLATDVYGDTPGETEVQESYRNASLEIRAMTIDFLACHMEYVQGKEVHWRQAFAVSVVAILGERKLAYLFALSDFNSCYMVCPDCEYCDEEIEFGYFDPSERIEAIKVPSVKWDGESLEDVKLWLFNLFALLRDKEGTEYLRYFFGTYVCPECGKRMDVLAGMEEYYFGE